MVSLRGIKVKGIFDSHCGFPVIRAGITAKQYSLPDCNKTDRCIINSGSPVYNKGHFRVPLIGTLAFPTVIKLRGALGNHRVFLVIKQRQLSIMNYSFPDCDKTKGQIR